MMKYLRGYIYNKVYACVLVVMSLVSLVLVGCVRDGDEAQVSVSQYTDDDIKSYGDLFEVFWQVMNQRYNYLNEQQGDFSLNWEQVYREYRPKFDALQTFDRGSQWTNGQIQAEHDKAKGYFTEIVSRIVDQHFRLKVKLPMSHTAFDEVTFRSGMDKERELSFPLAERFDFMLSQLDAGDGQTFSFVSSDFVMQGGFLKNHHDVYYLGFSAFSLSSKCYHAYRGSYLPNDATGSYSLSVQDVEEHARQLVADASVRQEVQALAVDLLTSLDNYMESDEVRAAVEKMQGYAQKGEFDGLVEAASKAYASAPFLVPLSGSDDTQANVESKLDKFVTTSPRYRLLASESRFYAWFVQRLSSYLCYVREYETYCSDLCFTLNNPLVEQYPSHFLRSLASGKIGKLILDLRGNGGGSVSDANMLTDYLVNHTAVYAYVRMKEDGNPYSYTPWIPQSVVPGARSIGRDVPIVVLLDKGSASMSEVSTLILKSQGSHVAVVGRNSAGAFAMLCSGDVENGGWNGNVTSYLNFYMPFMAAKDAEHHLLEGIGITPDYLLDSMTQEEMGQISSSSPMASDRFLDKAIEVLERK